MYHQLFLQADLDKDKYIGQNEAVPFLRQSGILDQHLGSVRFSSVPLFMNLKIWTQVNKNGLGRLNVNAFAVAMRLVALAQSSQAPTLQNMLAAKGEYTIWI